MSVDGIQRKNQLVSPRNGAVATPRGGARVGSGRKPDAWKKMFSDALANGVTPEEAAAIIRSLVDQAKSGNVQAANVILERMLGKVPQAVQHQGDAAAPLRIIVEYDS